VGALKKVFGNWWVVSGLIVLLAVLLLAVLLPWVVHPLGAWWVRLLIVLGILLIWGICAVIRLMSRKKASDELAKSLEQPSPGEGGVIDQRLKEAMASLRSASGKRRDYLYSRPWYVIIGPPGAGKSTALINSGLRFPFSNTALKGVGGTRNLDFWFADEAVLVDTAGRYTAQDSDPGQDAQAWMAFLKLLKKHRPVSPVNGVLVAIGLDEISEVSAAQLDAHAATVRRRLAELQAALEVATPVYVLFTKVDLIAGFAEFFDDLDVEGRRSVLGSTLPWRPGTHAGAADLATAFDKVAQAVADRASSRLQAELDARRRSLVVGFPAQLRSLRSRAVRFLEGAFPGDAASAPLRGFYFTSGVQQGTPLDRLLAGTASVFDKPMRAEGQGRAFFINRLLSEVVIPEAGLVQTLAGARSKRTMRTAAGLAAVAVVSLIVLGLWIWSFAGNRGLQNRLAAGAQNSVQQARADGLDLVEVRESDPDLEAELAYLRGLRDLPGGYAETAKGTPISLRFGLYQRGLSRRAIEAYHQALQRVLLPRMLLRLERYMGQNGQNPLLIYEPLKVYLMLGGQAPALDREAVKAWAVSDWQTLYPGEDREGLRKELGQHLDALLEDKQFGSVWPDRTAPLDGALVTAARQSVQTMSMADRAYAILKQRAAASGQSNWRADAVLSSGDGQAFADGSVVLGQTVPYFFTRAGFEKAYQSGVQDVQGELEKDLWVLGGEQNRESVQAQMANVRPGVARLYAQEYNKVWDGVLASLRPADYFTNPAAFGAATGTPPPLKTLLLDVRKNTDLSAAKSGPANALAGAVAGKVAAAASAAGFDTVENVSAGQLITNHFKPVSAFVGDGKAPAPVDEFVAKLKTAVTAKGAADRAGGLGGSDAAQAQLNQAMSELAASSATAPALVQGFVSGAAKQGDQAQLTSAQGAVTAPYNGTLASACQSITDNRYPFVAASKNDAPVIDVIRMFGINGQIDGYVNQRLRPLLDTAGPVWRWRIEDPVASTLDPTSAGEFQRASQIRDLLTSGLNIKLEPQGFGGSVTAVEIAAGGQTNRFDAGQGGQRVVQWTPSGLPQAMMTLYHGTTKLKEYDFDGPWALFRLMDSAQKENAGPMAIKATFGDGAASATFRITLPDANNPFSRGGLWSFRCPPKL
jgi:type VI secretion system protein ImpL